MEKRESGRKPDSRFVSVNAAILQGQSPSSSRPDH